jgi:WD40 repeat protein
MALSNSTLQTYTYSESRGFQLIARGSYTGACLTQLRHLYVDNTTIRTLTAATDGHLAIWEARTSMLSSDGGRSGEYRSIHATRLHQSAIKTLDIRHQDTKSDGTSYLIITGGDDNALGVVHLRLEKTDRYEVKSKSIIRSAHAAAVTGVAITKVDGQSGEATVVSASNDQRVKKWRVMDWGARVQLLANEYSAVADAGDLEVLGGGEVMVGGVGVEVWDACG